LKRFSPYLLGRLAQMVGVVALVSLGTFALIRLVPGDPATTILGTRATPVLVARLRHELGLDQPFLAQLGQSVGRLLQGNLGTSILSHRSVASIVIPALWTTLAVISLAALMAVVVGIPLGLLAALGRSRAIDGSIRFVCVILLATPVVFVGIVATLVVAVKLRAAPAGGWAGSWPANFKFIWLPSASLSLYLIAIVARTVRAGAREAATGPYVEAAFTRGISPIAIAWRHILPNSLLPVVTIIGYQLAVLISGAVIVEAIFALPGIGQVLVVAVQQRDFPVVEGVAIVAAIAVVLLTLATDLLCLAVDPRIRGKL
jgi:peptide/nickel transport system permease protein